MVKKNLSNYFTRHIQVMLSSLGELWRQPFATVMTLLVIGIALALPAGLYVLLKNVEQVSAQWDNNVNQISVFLSPKTLDSRGQQLAKQFEQWPDIETAQYQSAKQSLEEFKALSGMSSIVDTLPQNPLPAVILVQPNTESTQALEALKKRLQEMQEVDLAELDMQWLQRLYSINSAVERGIAILGLLLSLSVLLIVGNTIRLLILNRQTEIRVIKLVGGTDAFVRRPFLYTGFWYGLLGGLIAWLILLIALSAVNGPINRLAELYNSQFTFNWHIAQTSIVLPFIGLLLGIIGSWLALGRHLNDIEPT